MIEKENTKKEILKKNVFDYIYYGSLSEGDNPSSEVTFQSVLNVEKKTSELKAFSRAISRDKSKNTFNYAVTNIQDEKNQGELY